MGQPLRFEPPRPEIHSHPHIPSVMTAKSLRFRLQLDRGVDHTGLLRFRHRYDSPCTYVGMVAGFSVSARTDEIRIRFPAAVQGGEAAEKTEGFLHLRILGARPEASPVPLDDPDGDRSSDRPWRSISSLYWAEIIRGVDLVLSGDGGGLSFMFVAWSGGDLNELRLSYRGTEPLQMDGDGALLLATAAGTLVQSAPALHRGVVHDPYPARQRYQIMGGSEARLHIREPRLYEGGRS